MPQTLITQVLVFITSLAEETMIELQPVNHGASQTPQTLITHAPLLFASPAEETIVEPQRQMAIFRSWGCQGSLGTQTQKVGQTRQREREKRNQQYQK